MKCLVINHIVGPYTYCPWPLLLLFIFRILSLYVAKYRTITEPFILEAWYNTCPTGTAKWSNNHLAVSTSKVCMMRARRVSDRQIRN